MYFLLVLMAASSRSRHDLLLWCDLTFAGGHGLCAHVQEREGELLRLLMPPVLLDGRVLWLCVILIPS